MAKPNRLNISSTNDSVSNLSSFLSDLESGGANLGNDSIATHSFLVSNMHCPSCVSYIQETLSKLRPLVKSISPSLVSSWVSVVHKRELSACEIRAALEDAGFNVCDFTPNYGTSYGNKLSPFSLDGEIGYLDQFIDRFHSGKTGESSNKFGPSKKHIQNCEACRLGTDSESGPSTEKTAPSQTEPGIKLDSKVVLAADDVEGEDIWRVSLAIGGMTCTSCVNAINEQLKPKPWINKVSVNLISHSATIDFFGEQHQGHIVEAIEDIGYDVTIVSVTNLNKLKNDASLGQHAIRKIDILINGMYCDHCPMRILTSLGTLGNLVMVEKPMTVIDPILSISYSPQAPDFTIRNILKAISDASIDEDEPFKVSVYHPPTLEERSRLIHLRERLRIVIRVFVTLAIAIPTFIIGIVYMSLVPASNRGRQFLMAPLRAGVSRSQWALFIMATPVWFLCADVFHIRALKEMKVMWRPGSDTPFFQRFYRFGSMNMLISLGTSIAYISSLAQLINAGILQRQIPDNDAYYFDSVVFLTLFLLVGRLIEAYSKSKSGDAVQMLGKLRPTEALLIESSSDQEMAAGNEPVDRAQGGILKRVNIDLLEYGDTVKVLHGASPPCDGIIVQGETRFDESSLTGESKLVKKVAGDEVFSGTVNKDLPVSIKITGVAGSTMLDQIVKAVREGQTRRAPMERIADRLTSYFVPSVTLIAITTWIIWLALGYSGSLPLQYLGQVSGGWAAWSLQFAIAVFVVACPCGLALAAPTALFVGGGLAAQHGILVKGGGEAFEKASRLDCVVFDKTGTITVGEQSAVTGFLPQTLPFQFSSFGELCVDEMILGMIRVMEENSSHAVAQALRVHCKVEDIRDTRFESTNIEEVPGKGMRGSFRIFNAVPGSEEVAMAIGNEALMAEHKVGITRDVQTLLNIWKLEGKSVVLVAVSIDRASPKDTPSPVEQTWHLANIFAVSDPIRPESTEIIKQLKQRGLQIWMLSGDNQMTANAIGAQVGIPEANIIAGVLPSEKAEVIKHLQKSLKPRRGLRSGAEHVQKRALIAMVGDGINDSAALTTADVGIAIGSGSDIAISSAEFVLISSNLNALITLLDLSVVVFRRIKFNFAWALVYNIIMIPFAAGAFYPLHARLDPVWASLAMAASSISVVCSSLALRSKSPFLGFKAREQAVEDQEV